MIEEVESEKSTEKSTEDSTEKSSESSGENSGESSGDSPGENSTGNSAADWADIHARVDAAGEATAAARHREIEFSEEILAQRARKLAQPLARPEDANTDGAIVARLGETLVAFALRHVVEILRPRGLTALPGSQPPATFVIGWRGRVITVLDLNGARATGGAAVTETMRILILGERRGMLGVLVDDVDTVRSVRMDQVHPTPSAFGGADWIRGMTDDAIAVVDVPVLLAQYDK
ncbi:MAG: chemotaxis protein CheW [Gemmatimonadaceae bacterium]